MKTRKRTKKSCYKRTAQDLDRELAAMSLEDRAVYPPPPRRVMLIGSASEGRNGTSLSAFSPRRIILRRGCVSSMGAGTIFIGSPAAWTCSCEKMDVYLFDSILQPSACPVAATSCSVSSCRPCRSRGICSRTTAYPSFSGTSTRIGSPSASNIPTT